MDRQHLQDSAQGEANKDSSSERGAGRVRLVSSRRGGADNDDPQMRPPSATDNLRRFSTGRSGRPNPDHQDPNNPSTASRTSMHMNTMMNTMTGSEDAFAFPTTSRSYSWESQHSSDNEDRGVNPTSSSNARSSSRTSMTRDQRKFDMTTPTLIDEDEEEEMYALHQRSASRQQRYGGHDEQQRSSALSGRLSSGTDDLYHRRTPGASMYKSSFQEPSPDRQFQSTASVSASSAAAAGRRHTPGPLDMMRSTSAASGSSVGASVAKSRGGGGSSSNVMSHEQVDESAVLGFGLTLSSPVASGSRDRPGKDNKQGSAWGAQPPTTTTSTEYQQQHQQPNRPPRAPGTGPEQQQEQASSQPRGDFTFTPWTPGGQFQTSRQSACSPNTLRLTEDLGNLLFDAEEDSTDQTNQYVFRGAGQQQQSSDSGISLTESWTSSYVFNSEHQTGGTVSRVPHTTMPTTSRGSTNRGGRRGGRNDSTSRRSRGHDRPSGATRVSEEQRQYHMASFLQHAQQPTPVRGTQMQMHPQEQMQASQQSNPFLSGGTDGPTASSAASVASGDGSVAGSYPSSSDNMGQQQPRFFNFGGAFAPPAKDAAAGFRRPAPASVGGQMPPSRSGNFFVGQQPEGQSQLGPTSFGDNHPTRYKEGDPSNFADAGPHGFTDPTVFGEGGPTNLASKVPGFGESEPSSSGPFQSQSFQPLPPMAGPSRDSPYQHGFPSASPGFASPNPSFGMSNAIPYSYQHHPQEQSGMHANASEFFPMAPPPAPTPPPQQHHQHQRVPVHQHQPQQHQPQQHQHPQPPSSQRWSGGTPNQFGSTAAKPSWSGQPGAWTGGDYGYGGQPSHQPPGMDSRVVMSPAPPHAQPWPEQRGPDYPPHPSPHMFEAASPAQFEVPPQPLVAPSPSPVSTASVGAGQPQSRREQSQSQQSRQKSGRKGNSRRNAKQGKSERLKKTDSGSGARKPTTVNPSDKSSSTGGKKKRHSKGRDSKTPEADSACSTPSNVPTPANVPGGDEGIPDDPATQKKSELIESPATRSAFKDFYRRFRSAERASFQGAEDLALKSLGDGSIPGKVHWRVYLELADLAKRSNRFADARRLYQQVCQLQPYASQGWLEYSKLEEECGHLNRGARILRAGLEYCEYSENLLTRAIKHEEKMGNLSRARELLARLKHVGIEKVWRTVLEGALLEARAGNVVMARRVLKYLMHHVPWYGPLYLEAYRLERDLGRTSEALQVVERGLAAIPRYGPLWFGAFRLCEEIDIMSKEYSLPRTMSMIDRATASISKELIWKVHLDAAQMLERASLDLRAALDDAGIGADSEQFQTALSHCRSRFAMTILNCPPNLRWKVWLASGRMEIGVGNTDKARKLFLRAHRVVPDKGRATTLLECARLEEFTGDFELANAILCKSRIEYGTDWKVWLESVLLEIRGGQHARAIKLAKGALDLHPGTGRLWAALVQLRYFEGGEEAQFSSLKKALNAVPKSGEVWCEGGRIHLNPFSHTFNLERTRRHLFFATKFTPQYGDSFLESIRLELLEQWVAPMAVLVWDASKSFFFDSDKSNLQEAISKYIYNLAVELASVCREGDKGGKLEKAIKGPNMLNNSTVSLIREQLETTYRLSSVDLTDLELRCANADPNYGLLWFHCRHGPTDTARRILARASEKVVIDVRRFVHLYVAAMVRHSALMDMLATEGNEESSALPSIDDDAAWEELVDARMLAVPSLYDILHYDKNDNDEEKNREKGVVFLENTIAGSTFATGLAELNKRQPIGDLSLNERRKALFGTDALFS